MNQKFCIETFLSFSCNGIFSKKLNFFGFFAVMLCTWTLIIYFNSVLSVWYVIFTYINKLKLLKILLHQYLRKPTYPEKYDNCNASTVKLQDLTRAHRINCFNALKKYFWTWLKSFTSQQVQSFSSNILLPLAECCIRWIQDERWSILNHHCFLNSSHFLSFDVNH